MTVTSRDLPFLSRSFYRAPNEVAAAALYAHGGRAVDNRNRR